MEKILIIDDDKMTRMLFNIALSKAGYNVVEAENGELGIQKVSSEKPDLVITDYQMPGKNGLEVLAEIRKQNNKLPVIMLTAFGDVVLTIKSIQEGAYEYLEKPVNPELLKASVHKALSSVKRSNSLSGVI